MRAPSRMNRPKRAKSRDAAWMQQPLISRPVFDRIQVASCYMPARDQTFSDRYCASGFFVASPTSTPTRLVSPVL